MMLACREGHDRVVKTLLKAQANADAQSEVTCTLSIYILYDTIALCHCVW